MFQNLGEQTIDNGQEQIRNKGLKIITNIFAKKYILIYAISFMASTVGITGDLSPFSLSILAACFSNSVPLLGVVIVSAIGNGIRFGVTGALSYLLTVLVMIATLYMLKPKYNEEEKNEKIKIAKNVFIATLIIQLAKSAMGVFTTYDALFAITFAILTVVFYKIFVNSISILENIKEKRAFSIEEVIGTSLLLAIAVSCFGNFSLLGFSIRNVLSILIVLVLGWKNGVLIGTTAGVTIGVTIGVITGSEPIIIAAYAISGMIAGILNRFGKIGVIIGFSLGNVVLAYVSNGYTVELIYFKEILIASIALLAIPKSISIDIEEFTGGSRFLPLGRERTLTKSKETVDKLNNVSNTLKQMANTYNNNENRDNNLKDEDNKQIFISELLDCLDPYKDNMLYDDLTKTDSIIVDKVFNILIDKQEIGREDLLKTFEECNSYIIGFDDKEISKYLEESIAQVVRSINTAYKMSKTNFVWNKKLEENKRSIETQLNGVSNVISGIAKDIEKEIKTDGKYKNEVAEIIELLKQKEILISEISIKKESRFLVDMYLEEYAESEVIEEILSKVLKEKIVLNQDISEGKKYNFLSDDKYIMALGNSSESKDGNIISGDSMLNIRLKDGKYLIALSDGMGSGEKARNSSAQTLKMLESLLLTGFDRKNSIELITTSLINQDNEMFSTLDMAIVDLYNGKIEFIKSGACPTYIRNKKKVQMIKSTSLPLGIVNHSNLEVFDRDLQTGDIMLMCTDGILEANVEYKNKELWIKYLLEDIESTNTKKIADLLLSESIDNNFGKAKDDMSVIVCKFMEKDI